MIHKHLVAAIIVSLSSALLCASCADLDPGGSAPETEEAGGEPTNEASQAAYENIFKFVQTIKDDGEGKGGGWQEATANLKFLEWRRTFLPIFWDCPIKVGMPVRAQFHGYISGRSATQMTAAATTDATDDLMVSRPTWAGATTEHCKQLREEIRVRLDPPGRRLGARVTPW